MTALTVRLERSLERQLSRMSKKLRRTRSEIVRDAIRRRLASLQFEEARRQLMPLAESTGYLTDDDVFCDVS